MIEKPKMIPRFLNLIARRTGSPSITMIEQTSEEIKGIHFGHISWRCQMGCWINRSDLRTEVWPKYEFDNF